MDPTLIMNRVIARDRARAITSLMSDEVENIPPAAREAFWDEIKNSPMARAELVIKQPVTIEPMTDDEAKRFGDTLMPFGEFKGIKISDVPLDRLEWYSDSKFQKQLIRYLNSPKIKTERESDD